MKLDQYIHKKLYFNTHYLGLIIFFPVFIQKCQINPSLLLNFNLVSIFKKMIQFCPFLLNFLKLIKNFFHQN